MNPLKSYIEPHHSLAGDSTSGSHNMDMDLSWVYPVSSAIATTFTTTFAVLSTITIYALRIVIWPISILYGAFLVVFAPVIYTLQFLFAPVFYFMSLVPNLKVSSLMHQELGIKLLTLIKASVYIRKSSKAS